MNLGIWVELAVAAFALAILGVAAWVRFSLGAVRELTIRELLSDRLQRTTDAEADETSKLREAVLLVELLSAGVATALVAHAGWRLESTFGFIIGLLGATALHVLLGRIIPAAFVRRTVESESPWPARLGRALRALFFPVIWPVERVVAGLSRIADRREEQAEGEQANAFGPGSEAQLNGQNADDFEVDEQDMISGILHLVDATAEEIMVPRLDVVAISRDATIAEAVDVAISAGHSRIPVFGENIDEIVGIVYAKDLLKYVTEEHRNQTIESEIRPAHFVPESKRVDDLLQELQASKIHLAVVVDEYGGTAGVVTIEDILEEIVGEIEDEYDRELPRIEVVDEDTVVVDGRVLADDVYEELEIAWDERPQGTIAGLIQRELGRIPRAGDQVERTGLKLTVESVERRRVRRVRCERVPVPGVDAEASDSTVSSRH